MFAFQRRLDGDVAIVALNRGEEEATVDIPLAAGAPAEGLRDVWNEQEIKQKGQILTGVCIPPRAGAVILNVAG